MKGTNVQHQLTPDIATPACSLQGHACLDLVPLCQRICVHVSKVCEALSCKEQEQCPAYILTTALGCMMLVEDAHKHSKNI
eukprot:1152272-Pelagomonas_calceolata.AAC.14